MTAKIIGLAHAQDTLLFDPAPFMSVCAKCSEARLQLGYSTWGLLRRLKRNRPIEACCVICNQFWPITAQERVRLAKEFEHLRLR